jgi:hypothetical protein
MIFPEWLPVYGDQKYRNKKCPVESAEQITFFNTLRRDHPELAIIAIHPRNEGKRTAQQTQRQKAEGMTAGASDIIIPTLRPFICELKRQDHTLCHWEPDQLKYMATAHKQGAFVCVALGYKAALEALEVWIGTK